MSPERQRVNRKPIVINTTANPELVAALDAAGISRAYALQRGIIVSLRERRGVIDDPEAPS